MLQLQVIGNLGADAECKEYNGSKFTTFRVAHNTSWTDSQGVKHNDTKWVECIMNDHPAVAPYLTAGTLIAVIGEPDIDVYSSEKFRRFMGRFKLRVSRVELLGSSTRQDSVPSRLFDAQGNMLDVATYHHVEVANARLRSERGREYYSDDNGWVFPIIDTAQSPQEAATEPTQSQQEAATEPTQSQQEAAASSQAAPSSDAADPVEIARQQATRQRSNRAKNK